jgi:FkbM family methyltransferase
MSFISYAQNFEDLMLWRALRHVEKGTYVDVGAQHPTNDSVSKAFYLNGWRGVHIEPVPQYAELLRQDRPDEVVLQVALGEAEGLLSLNVIPETGLSTAVDQYAQSHQEHGFATQQIHVPMLTLKTALGMLAGRELHWLKIDVEGFETQVLKGWDSRALRPWVMVVEATIPGSSEADYEAWDPIVREAGYRFVYFDGLNRFYIADEHPELAAAFATPPNVFDDVRLSGYASWGLYREVEERQQALLADAKADAAAQLAEHDRLHEQYVAKHEALVALGEQLTASSEELAALGEQLTASTGELTALTAQLAESSEERAALTAQLATLRKENQDSSHQLAGMHATIHEWWSVADRLNHELKAVHASTSWRITAPIRYASTFVRRLPALPSRGASWVTRRTRQAARPLLVWSMRTVLAHSGLRERALKIVRRYPGLTQYLRGFAGRAGLIGMPVSAPAAAVFQHHAAAMDAGSTRDLPPQIASIYKQLKKQSYKE